MYIVLNIVKIIVYNKRLAARFFKLIFTTECSAESSGTNYSKIEEMFYFKSKQLFEATVSVQAKEAVVSESDWVGTSVVFHASIEFTPGMEFEDIVHYALIDTETNTVVKVAFLSPRLASSTRLLVHQ
jgi:hypothetical protein